MHQQNLQGHYAGFASRLLAFVLDIVFLAVSLALAFWFVTTVNSFFGLEEIIHAILGANGVAAVQAVVAVVLVLSYFVFFWVLLGQTLGKILFGLRIVRTDGSRISFFRAVLRLIGYFISALVFYLGFIWILADDRRQGWHDKIAGTCVVYSWAARPDENFLRDRF